MSKNKFRGKSIEGVWVYGYYVSIHGFAFIVPFDGITESTEFASEAITPDKFIVVYPESVAQYTGLKDKNGKEIYEGDVMKRPQQNADKTPNGNHYKVVEWKIFGNNSVGFNVSAQCDKYEIIGDIYQNPELLESKKEAKK